MDNIEIVYEDPFILVVNKPSGLTVTNSETTKEPTLADYLKDYFKGEGNLDRMGIVHRLDRDTSGLLVVAKSEEILAQLQAQFKQRIVKKEYLALAHGLIKEPGKIEAPILRHPGNREKFTVWQGGREAVTEYIPVNQFQLSKDVLLKIFPDFNKIQMRKLGRMRYGEFTFLRCHPLTGRTHQIRVHLKYIGHPIVSDEKYVGRRMYRLDKRWCPRQFLHAAKLGFRHPENGHWMEFESGLPEDLKQVLTIFN